MNKIIFAVAVLMLANQAVYAADPGCEAEVAEKKLAGAAKNSFTKKCIADASK